MKLYTEEQVRQAMQESKYAFSTDKGYDEILKSITPIELPSDEEIEEKFNTNPDRLDSKMYESGFRDGAKWMKEQILNQIK